MTATDELRRMLDERGVEWERGRTAETIVMEPFDVLYGERLDGRMRIYFRSYLFPEQAIEATLGRGTCHIVKTWSDSDYVDGWRYRCSECMCFIPVIERDPETGDVISAANFCPNCGRRVVAGDES